MAASTLCILNVVSRHIMYILKYCSNNYILSNKLLPYHIITVKRRGNTSFNNKTNYETENPQLLFVVYNYIL